MTRRTFSFLAASAWSPAAAPLRIKVAAAPYLSLSPFHLAIERGYFREQGIELDLATLTRSADVIPVLAKGDIDVALYSISPPLLNAIGKGARIRIVAARDQALPDCSYSASLYARRPITTVAGLKGKRVANGQPAGIVEFALDRALAKAGLSPSDIETVPMRPAEAAAALLRGEIHALTASDLVGMAALEKPEVGLLTTLGRTLPGFQFAFISFGRRLLDGPVDEGARFLRAFFRGAREYAAGATPAFVDDFAAKSGIDARIFRALCRQHVVTDGHVDVASLEKLATWARGKGYSERDVNVAGAVDLRFLEAANKK
ncbi:MAG: ABC transporter substrate-binding protein [Bryobacteraceae bacterium]